MPISTVVLTGPLFEAGVDARVQAAAVDVVRELTELGVQRLTSAFPTGVPVKTGNYRRNINSMIRGSRSQIDDSGVIYGPWLEGTSSRNQTTRFKGYQSFRRAGQYLQEQVPIVSDKHAQKLVKDLGG